MKFIKHPALITEIIEIPYYSKIDIFLNTISNLIPFTNKSATPPINITRINGKIRVSETIIDFEDLKVELGDMFKELIIDKFKMYNVYVVSIKDNSALCQIDWFEII